jgi:hypothetical protein
MILEIDGQKSYNGYTVRYFPPESGITTKLHMYHADMENECDVCAIPFDHTNKHDMEKIVMFAKYWIDSYRNRKVALSSLAVSLFPSHARLTQEDKDVLNQASDFIKEISRMGNVTEGERMLADKLKDIADRF